MWAGPRVHPRFDEDQSCDVEPHQQQRQQPQGDYHSPTNQYQRQVMSLQNSGQQMFFAQNKTSPYRRMPPALNFNQHPLTQQHQPQFNSPKSQYSPQGGRSPSHAATMFRDSPIHCTQKLPYNVDAERKLVLVNPADDVLAAQALSVLQNREECSTGRRGLGENSGATTPIHDSDYQRRHFMMKTSPQGSPYTRPSSNTFLVRLQPLESENLEGSVGKMRKPRRFWNLVDNVISEVRQFMSDKGLTRMPTLYELKKHGCSSLYRALYSHGGWQVIADKMGLGETSQSPVSDVDSSASTAVAIEAAA